MHSVKHNAAWLPFIQTVRTEHYSYDPLRMKQIRELVDDFEAGNLELVGNDRL